MPPFHVGDLYDYLNWLEHHLDMLGATLHTEDGHLDVQILGDGAPCLLVIQKHRLEFPNGCYLDFRLRVDEYLEVRDYRFHFARPDDSWIWRLDKHPLPGSPFAVPHVHQPPDFSVHTPHDEVEVDEVVKRILDSGELERGLE